MSEEKDEAPELSPEAFFAALSGAPAGYGPGYDGRLDRYRDFRTLFLGSPQGLRVLHELLRQCGVNRNSVRPGPIDPHRVAFNEGARNIGLFLIGTINLEPVEQPARTNTTRGKT